MPWTARNTGLEILNKWWVTPTIADSDVTVAYQPIGADDVDNSYINLANPGTNDASVIVAPTWTVEDGWIFDGTQSLDTLVVGNGLQTIIARAGTNTTSADNLFGYNSTKDSFMRIDSNGSSQLNAQMGYNTSINFGIFENADINDSVMCAARNQGYLNGNPFSSITGSLDTWSFSTINIAGQNFGINQLDGTMKAFALYNRQLTTAEVIDLTAQMLALTSSRPNPQRVNYIVQTPSSKRLNSTSHELLIATDAGIFHTTNGGRSWTNITLPDPSNAEFSDSPAATISELAFHWIDYSPGSESIIYALAEKLSVNRQWLYKSTDDLSTWISRGIVTI